jgi:hypothetical protein
MGRNHANRIVSEIDPIYMKDDFYENMNWQPQRLLRVAAYTCVLTGGGIPESSLETREKFYKTIISANPTWEYAGLYADEEVGGTRTPNRKEFDRMLEDCKEGKINLILAKNLMCFSQNYGTCMKAVEQLLTLVPPVNIYFVENHVHTFVANKISLLSVITRIRESRTPRNPRKKLALQE